MNVPLSDFRLAGPHRGLLGVALLAAAVAPFILSVSTAKAAQAAVARLEAGKAIEREIRGGETHVYEVVVPPGRVVTGVVDQRGVDVAVRIVDPTGATVATLDSPNGTAGPEPWVLEAKGKGAGTWRIEVSPLDATARAGRYEARIDEIVTTDEYAERLAKLRYQSPRMLRLWIEWRAQGAAAVEGFAKEMEGHTPLVEPVAGDPHHDVLLTFVRRARSETRYVGIVGAPPALNIESALLRFEETDLLYLTVRAPRDARFTYSFRPGDPPDGAAGSWHLLAAQFTGLEPDSWNPRRFGGSSLVELPLAPLQPWTQRAEGVPQGRLVDRTIHSDILGEDRKVSVYLPSGFDPLGGPYPYVVVFDGEVYGTGPVPLVPTPTILDNLIAQGKVPPMLGVLVDSQGTRMRDLAMSARFGDFLARELAPWVRREYRAADDPARATLAGSSLGGLSAAYCAFHHPDVFGNALSQSGSFWFSPGAFEAEVPYRLETGALIREIVAAPTQPLRIWMEVGIFEFGGALNGANQVAQNRHMRDVLAAKGYDVSYREYSGGHDYACWRGSLADGLMALAGVARKPASR